MLAAEFVSQALDRRAPTPSIPWLDDLRAVSLARFRAVGFPTPTQEDWRETNLEVVTSTPFQSYEARELAIHSGDLSTWVDEAGTPAALLVMVNGRLDPQLSQHRHLTSKARVGSLVAAIARRESWLEPFFTRVARVEDDPFTALNTAVFEDGVVVYIPDRVIVPRPIVIEHLSVAGERPLMSNPRVLVVLGEGAEATLIESFVGKGSLPSFTNLVVETRLGANARLDHVRLVRESEQNSHIATSHTRVEQHAHLRMQSIALTGNLTRSAEFVDLAGAGAGADLDGLFAPAGGHHAEMRTTVVHEGCRTESRQVYKGIIDGRSRGAFTGKVIVRPGAQKTDAWQLNQNLLLSRGALVDSKPQLEIYADDVRCRHGSTTGRLSEEALFYLGSRGVGEVEARGILTYGFARDVVERLPSAMARKVVLRELARRWPGIEELTEAQRC